jgi:hypothetical protein
MPYPCRPALTDLTTRSSRKEDHRPACYVLDVRPTQSVKYDVGDLPLVFEERILLLRPCRKMEMELRLLAFDGDAGVVP